MGLDICLHRAHSYADAMTFFGYLSRGQLWFIFHTDLYSIYLDTQIFHINWRILFANSKKYFTTQSKKEEEKKDQVIISPHSLVGVSLQTRVEYLQTVKLIS